MKPTIRKEYILPVVAIIIAGVIIFTVISGSGIFKPEEKIEPPAPSISIGCDEVLWNNTEDVLEASVGNIINPSFEWKLDGKVIGTGQRLSWKFESGEHFISLNVSFDNQTLSSMKSISVIDSVDGITMRDYEASENQRGFQTMFNGKSKGVKEVQVYIDSQPASQVNACGTVSSNALPAGVHTWKAQYHGIEIGSGTFNIQEISDLKISGIDVAPSYQAGSVVEAKITLINTGSVKITEFSTTTLAVNNDYAWMGDKAKREYVDSYTVDIKPGETYVIPIRMTIPEKVSGIRPAGKYTITYSVLLKNQIVDSKIVNTRVI